MNPLDARRRILGKGVYKKTVEGNPAIAQGSLARRCPGITMQGWTEQEQYEGNQLFDKTGIELTNMPLYIPINVGDGQFTLSTLYLNNERKDVFFLPGNVVVGASSSTNGVDRNTTRTVSSEDGYVTVALRLNSEGDMNPLDYNIMLNEGSSALPYEPYTGGAPSPSPDYQQEIKNAGKYDEGTGKHQYGVKLTGANLFDYSPFVNDDGYITSSYAAPKQVPSPFHVKEGEKYVLITKGTVESANEYSSIYFGEDDLSYFDNKTKILATGLIYSAFSGGVQRRYIMTATKTCDITKCMVHGSGYIKNAYIVEEFGLFNYIDGVSENYEPYRTPQTATLTSDRPLTKWDKLEKRNGQWGWVYKSAEKVLDGTEGYVTGSGNYISDFSSNCYTVISDMVIDGRDNAFMNRLSNIDYSWTLADAIGFSKNLDQLHVRISNADLGTTGESSASEVNAAMKAYMAQQYEEGNPFIFWYETAEETFVPLSTSEQEQMNALYTFRPTTVLSNDCECNMGLTYKTKKSLEVTT